MQIKKLVPPLTEQWKAIYERERPNLTPNAITGEALDNYIRDRFDAEPSKDEELLSNVREMLAQSTLVQQKKKDGQLQPVAYRLEDGTVIGIDLLTGCFIVQNNDAIRDELTFIKGLDEADLDNVVLTVDWLRCRKQREEKAEEARKRFFQVVRDGEGRAAYQAVCTAGRTQGTYVAFIRGKRCKSKASFFREFSAAMQFPSYFGENWDALNECLQDLNEWLSFKAITIVIEDYDLLFGSCKRGKRNRETLRSIFEDAAAFWGIRDVAFSVIAVCSK